MTEIWLLRRSKNGDYCLQIQDGDDAPDVEKTDRLMRFKSGNKAFAAFDKLCMIDNDRQLNINFSSWRS